MIEIIHKRACWKNGTTVNEWRGSSITLNVNQINNSNMHVHILYINNISHGCFDYYKILGGIKI